MEEEDDEDEVVGDSNAGADGADKGFFLARVAERGPDLLGDAADSDAGGGGGGGGGGGEGSAAAIR